MSTKGSHSCHLFLFQVMLIVLPLSIQLQHLVLLALARPSGRSTLPCPSAGPCRVGEELIVGIAEPGLRWLRCGLVLLTTQF